MDTMWQEYGIEELEKGMQKLFPTFRISVTDLMTQILQGDILGAVGCLLKEVIREMSNSATGIRNILIWLIVLGILSALLIHFVEVFDKHQIADLSFYFIYLLMGVILLQCFSGVLETARETMENIVLFVRLMVPTFLLTVGVASGPVTVGAGYQLMLLLIYGTEKILLGVVLPLIYSYCLLTMINGIWVEEKLALLADLLEKLIGWILKASLGVVTGISLFQSLITPVVDSLKNSAVEKAVSVLPGIGNAADGVLELALGSAVVIRNSVGVLLLLLLVAGCAVPLLQILFTAGFIKCATAFMGIVSDKRITNCTDRMGNAMMLLFRTVGTALLWLYHVIGQVGIFLICAQTLIHFRPRESYEKYLKLLLSVMLLIQLLQPLLTVLGGDEIAGTDVQAAEFAEEIRTVLEQAAVQAEQTEDEIQAVTDTAAEETEPPDASDPVKIRVEIPEIEETEIKIR